MMKRLRYRLLLSGLLMMGSLNSGATSISDSDAIIVEPPTDIIHPQPPKPTYKQPSFSTLNRYTWQLIEVQESQNSLSDNNAIKLILDIRPDMLVFKDNCQHYQVSFLNILSGDFPYSYNDIQTKSTCDTDQSGRQNDALPNLKKILRQSSQTQYVSRRFGFQWLDARMQPTENPTDISTDSPEHKLPEQAYLAINLDTPIYPKQTTRLILKGELKPVAKTNGSDSVLTKRILERYRWQLRQALDSDDKFIEEFGFSDIPILASFHTVPRHEHTNDTLSYASFSSDCNGIGGDYVLTPTNTLLIGYGPQTVMGCGTMRERAEDTLRALMHHSTSQLTLKFYPKKANNETADTSPTKETDGTYMLIQEFDTGEQLVWEGVEKDSDW